MEALKLSCPGCAAPLHPEEGAAVTTCTYCGSTVRLSLPTAAPGASGPGIPHLLAPFRITRADFFKAAAAWFLKEDYLADEVVEKLDLTSAKGLYLPFFQHTVKYTAHWSASSGYRRYNKSKKEWVVQWHPASGTVAGVWSGLGIACNLLPDAIASFCETQVPMGPALQEFTSPAPGGFGQVKESTPAQKVFESRESRRLAKDIGERVRKAIPGDENKDVTWSVDVQMVSVSRYSLPFWTLPFTCQGKLLYYVASGLGLRLSAGLCPVDVTRKKRVRRLFAPSAVVAGVSVVAALALSRAESALGWEISLAAGFCVALGLLGWAAWKRSAILERARGLRVKRLAAFK